MGSLNFRHKNSPISSFNNYVDASYFIVNVFYFNSWRAKIKDVVAYFGWTSLKVQEALENMKDKF